MLTYKQYANKKAREIFKMIKDDTETMKYCLEEHWIMILYDSSDICEAIRADIEAGKIKPTIDDKYLEKYNSLIFSGFDSSHENVVYDLILDEITVKLDKLIEKELAKGETISA